MMLNPTLLPGLERLIAICQQYSLPCKLSPPLASAPKQGESVFGEPLDPQLAGVYRRLGEAEFGPLSIFRPDFEWNGLIPWNAALRKYDSVHFRSSLVFAKKTGFALYLATVPRLADEQGLQPVVYIEAMDMLSAVPVASSVDRFFDTYSRYLELMVVDPEYLDSGVPEASFPWGVPQLIASDKPLMEQIRAGRFDFLTDDDRDALDWLQKLRNAKP
jgi:hypothetical protein